MYYLVCVFGESADTRKCTSTEYLQIGQLENTETLERERK